MTGHFVNSEFDRKYTYRTRPLVFFWVQSASPLCLPAIRLEGFFHYPETLSPCHCCMLLASCRRSGTLLRPSVMSSV